MLSPQEQSRYSKQIILPEIKLEGQEKLASAKVLVIGAGGLGCPILQYLTAAGIGTLGIVDGDTVSISNLQRQVLYSEQEVGMKKAEVAQKKLNALNPHVTFNIYPVFLNSSNACDIMQDYDIIVDGSDNFPTRYLINDACVIMDKPLVSGAIYKFEGQVSVLNFKGGPTYRCLFPEPPGDGESPNCADIGVIATLPGIIGSIQANEVIKMVTGTGDVLSGKLLVIDTLTMNTHRFSFKLNSANKQINTLHDLPLQCEVTPSLISYDDLQKLLKEKDIQLVDVREIEEHDISNIGGINIPLSDFDTGSDILNPGNTIVLYCASGVRSNHAAKRLIQRGFRKVFSLQHGINPL